LGLFAPKDDFATLGVNSARGFLLPALCVRIDHNLIVLGGEIGPSSNFVVHHVELHLNIVIVFHALFVKLFEISFLGIIKLLL